MNCYNIGCLKQFDPNENTEKSCVYHLSQPVFHDGKKGWDCCKKFSTDFTTCLSTPGCQVGYHNPNKPAEPEKPKIDPKYDMPVVVVNPIVERPQRPSGDSEMIDLRVEVLSSLERELKKRQEEMEREELTKQSNGEASIPIGTPCKNKGCKKTFSSSEDNKQPCSYHKGEAIFHEGLKYWTCCLRKTTDWESFMAQEGCSTDQHVWTASAVSAVTDCRFDWFQTDPSLNLCFYARLVQPQSIAIKANGIKLSVSFAFQAGAGFTEKQFDLLEEIDPLTSSVTVGATKIEIILKKKRAFHWNSLEFSANDKI